MKEIKYRQAVYKEDGTFHYFHYWGFIKNGFVGPVLTSRITWQAAKKNSQQYIDIKDKNDKEIYEDDLWKWWDFKDKEHISIVVYDRTEFLLRNGDSYSVLHPECGEVIGNIYEHHDLKQPSKNGREVIMEDYEKAFKEFWANDCPNKIKNIVNIVHEWLHEFNIKAMRNAFETGQNPELINAAQALVDWLNDTGRTNKSRRGRVPEKLLSNLENQL